MVPPVLTCIQHDQCCRIQIYAVGGLFTFIQSAISDQWALLAPNGVLQLVGIGILGFLKSQYARYFGAYLIFMGTAGNSPLCTAYQANNAVGQWKRTFTSASLVGLVPSVVLLEPLCSEVKMRQDIVLACTHALLRRPSE